jgi:CubicO group peptidase (beta-lactamase class C family)
VLPWKGEQLVLLKSKSSRWRALTGGLIGLALCLGAAAPAAAHTIDPPQAFADEFIPRQLKEHQIPGAAIAVATKNGSLFAKGYGLADVETGRPVDAERTVFAPASVVKLITATAVMQLVEKGRIDLNADVNHYLTEFTIDDAYPGRPVTTAHLLTHTAGFAGGDYGTGAASPQEIHPLGAHLADHQPRRIRPPGTRAVYSNYGMGLAGHLVEVRSGMPFHRYVQENILGPLGMTNTTLAQPEPAAIGQALAPGYRLQDGRQVPATGAKYGHMPPHGAGFRSTAIDMAAFMQAHLNNGGKILQPESVRLMQGRRFGNAEGTSGMGYGFQEYTRNGQRLLVHRGNIPGYFAIMALIPEQGLGLYASYNGSGKGGPDSAWDLVNAFADRFAPSTPPKAGKPGQLPNPTQFAGGYRSAQAGDTADFGKLGALTSVVTVSADGAGILTTTGAVTLGAPEAKQWVQISPGLFQEKNGYRRIHFGTDGLLSTENPAGPLERLAWYHLPTLHLGVLGASLVILLLSTLVWPVVLTVRQVRHRPTRAPRLAGLPGWLTAALVVASAGSLVAMFANFEANQAAFFLGGSPLLSAIQTLPVLAAVAAAATLVTALLAWRRSWWSLIGRLHHTVVALAALAYLAVAVSYNLLGWS